MTAVDGHRAATGDDAGASATAKSAALPGGEPAASRPCGGPRVVCHLDRLLEARGMTLVELSERVGVTTVNLSVLKNDRAKAIRFTTLVAVCEALGCGVGDLLEVVPGQT